MLTMLIHVFVLFSPRVMDAFLIDGMEIIFRLAVAILNFGKEDLLSQDMEGMLKVFVTKNITIKGCWTGLESF